MDAGKRLNHTKRQIADTLKLPKDLSRNEPLISITGQSEVFIENYEGILECNETCVLVATAACRIRFEGKHLAVEYYTEEEMKIRGCILQISFV